jgi:NADPH:quinone reductase
MRAMIINSFGDIDVFERKEVEKPKPGPTQVLVEVKATSVNPVDYKLRKDGKEAGIILPAILGYDVAGIVREVGEAVQEFEPGDEVYYAPEINSNGSYAEFHVADESIVAHKPRNLNFEEAAAIPLAGATAWDALMDRALLQSGEKVLIHGFGGVGHLAVQIAKAAGCYVYVTCGRYDFDMAKKLGADEPIDYKNDDFVKQIGENKVDVVFDTAGAEAIARSIEVTKPFGRIVSIVSTEGDLNHAHRKNITLHFLYLQRERHKLDYLRNLIEWGKLKPIIDSVMELESVPDAHRRLESGKVRGKIVLKVG